MQLNERLQICLLALTSRYPIHVVDINEAVFIPPRLDARGWTAIELIKLFQSTAPDLLQAEARLVIDDQRCEIYLVKQSEEIPILWIHCRGKIPGCGGGIDARKKAQRQYVSA